MSFYFSDFSNLDKQEKIFFICMFLILSILIGLVKALYNKFIPTAVFSACPKSGDIGHWCVFILLYNWFGRTHILFLLLSGPFRVYLKESLHFLLFEDLVLIIERIYHFGFRILGCIFVVFYYIHSSGFWQRYVKHPKDYWLKCIVCQFYR